MTDRADPHERAAMPALNGTLTLRTAVQTLGGPDRIYDAANADPNWKPRPVGFTARLSIEREPLLWEGDNS